MGLLPAGFDFGAVFAVNYILVVAMGFGAHLEDYVVDGLGARQYEFQLREGFIRSRAV